MNQNLNLNGLNPLAYIGVNPYTPVPFVNRAADPTATDYANFYIGSMWLNTATKDVWMLVAKASGVSTWVKFTGANGSILSLSDTAGTKVYPTGNNIQLVGTSPLTVTSTPGSHLITFALSGSGVMQGLRTDDTNVVTPTAGIINLVGAHGLNTTGTVGPNSATVAINNAITLGDLSVIAAGSNALTIASGDISMTGSPLLAATNQMIKMVGGGHGGSISFFLDNVFIGLSAGNTTMTPGVALFNIGIGPTACLSLTTGTQNLAIGNDALRVCTIGNNNVCIGYVSGQAISTGSSNVTLGSSALSAGAGGVTTGSFNVAIGSTAGNTYTGNESSNILLNSVGAIADANTLRIGQSAGAGNRQLNKAFIHGIRGITTGVNDAIAVLVDSAGQLGTVSSSARYKENIVDMGSYSGVLSQLRPVVFNYKKHPAEAISVGLIAEEVEHVAPKLVVYDKDGNPETVKYHDLVPMLLNELIKLRKEVDELKAKCCKC